MQDEPIEDQSPSTEPAGADVDPFAVVLEAQLEDRTRRASGIDAQIAERRDALDAGIAELQAAFEGEIAQLRMSRLALQGEIRTIRELQQRMAGEIVDDYARTDGPGFAWDEDWPRNAADKVVKLLQSVGRPLHYRDIYNRLEALGVHKSRSTNPAEALLRNFYKDSRLFRPRRGTYFLASKRRKADEAGDAEE